MFWKKQAARMPTRDVQAEAVAAIIQGSAPTTPTKENPMREFLEDLIGCLCLFAMIPGLWFLLYGLGW